MKTFIIETTWISYRWHWFGNGYVVLPVGHKYNGKDYDQIPVDVHGWLTFWTKVKDLKWDKWTEFIAGCDPEDYIIGFDTCHCDDTEERWTKEAVEKETARLAAQLSNL